MKQMQIAFTLVLMLASATQSDAGSQVQTKLEGSAGLAGLIGNWVGTGDDGGAFDLSYRWALKKNVVVSRFNMGGQYAGYGLIYYDPAQSKILHAGVDSLGGIGRGHWEFTDEKAVWKMKYVGPDSQQRNMGIVYTPEGPKALKMEYYSIDENGEITGESRRTTQFQRKPAGKAKKSKLPEPSQTATLADLVNTGGFDWIIGNWTTTTDEGQTLNSSYAWAMNKNLINMTLKMGEYEGLGMIFYAQNEGKVMQIGADNMGGISRGVWDADGDKLVATLDFTAADGNKGKTAIVHTNLDAKTIKVALYAVHESGERAAEPWATMESKRQPKKAASKTPRQEVAE